MNDNQQFTSTVDHIEIFAFLALNIQSAQIGRHYYCSSHFRSRHFHFARKTQQVQAQRFIFE